MKVTLETRENMKHSIKTMIEAHYPLYPQQTQDEVLGAFKRQLLTNIGFMHSFWHKVVCCKRYTSDNPTALVRGKRVFAHEESFEMHPEGCNDSSLSTALKWAIKNI